MTRFIVVLVVFVGLAGLVPHYFEIFADRHAHAPVGDASDGAAESGAERPPKLPEAAYLGGGRTAVLHLNGQGHYGGLFRLNGRQVEGVIDTGATFVALNESTARDIGIALQPGDFTAVVETANGRTKAARTRIDSLEIGDIRQDDVSALVLPDSAMSQTLIGMNVLNRLRSYEVRDGVLNLKD